MEPITLEKIWGILIKVQTTLDNHLTSHIRNESRHFKITCILITLLGLGLIAYFFK